MGKAGEMRQSWIKVKGIRGKWERKCRVARRGKRK